MAQRAAVPAHEYHVLARQVGKGRRQAWQVEVVDDLRGVIAPGRGVEHGSVVGAQPEATSHGRTHCRVGPHEQVVARIPFYPNVAAKPVCPPQNVFGVRILRKQHVPAPRLTSHGDARAQTDPTPVEREPLEHGAVPRLQNDLMGAGHPSFAQPVVHHQ